MGKFSGMVVGSLIGTSCLLLACTNYQAHSSDSTPMKEPTIAMTTDPNQSVSSEDATAPSPTSTAPTAMMIEGTIEQVMESFPVQLTVTTNSGRYFVSLQSNTTIVQAGKAMDQFTLKPGQKVQITGTQPATADMALIAQSIQLR